MLAVAVAVAMIVTVSGLLLGRHEDPGETVDPARHASSEDAKPPAKSRDRRKPPQPEIPRLIGMTPDQVRHALEPTGLDVDLPSDCSPSDRARVVVQLPRPGGVLHFNKVRVWFDRTAICHGHIERPCAASQLRLTPFAHESYSADHLARDVGFRVENTGPSPCQLRETATITVTPSDGSADQVRGNPHRVELDSRLALHGPTGGGSYAIWSNWCGGRKGPMKVAIDLAGLHAETDVHAPACEDPKKASVMY
jgi:hypothetical protein